MARVDPFRLVRARVAASGLQWPISEEAVARFALFLGMFLATGALVPLLYIDEHMTLSDSDMAVMRLMLTPFMAMVPILVLSRAEEVADGLARNGAIVLLLAMSALSILWSINPEVSSRRVISLGVFTLFAFWAHARFGFEEFLRMMAHFLLACLIGSIVTAILFPNLGYMVGSNQLRGLFSHKNVLGQTLIMSVLVFLVALRHDLLPKEEVWLGLPLALGMAVLTDSATSLSIIISLCAAAAVLWWLTLPRLVVGISFAFALAAGAGILLMLVNDTELMFDLLGRDATFTGRTELWAFMWRVIEDRVWFGYGYQAFWSVLDYREYALQAFGWAVPNGHSGYLDLWLSVGLAGLLVTLMILAGGLIRGLRALFVGNRAAGEFLVMLIVAYAIRNSVESDLAGHTSLYWVALVVALNACAWSDVPVIARRSVIRHSQVMARRQLRLLARHDAATRAVRMLRRQTDGARRSAIPEGMSAPAAPQLAIATS